jgi:hypothetical protein
MQKGSGMCRTVGHKKEKQYVRSAVPEKLRAAFFVYSFWLLRPALFVDLWWLW